jgi:rhodanese-related sulfurtransferase
MRPTIRTVAVSLLIALCGAILAACSAAPAATPAAPAAPVAQAPFSNMSVQELKAALDGGEPLLVLDVRTPAEYVGDGHIAGSLLIPVDELPARLGELPADTPIACFCRSGNRSLIACETLAAAGFSDLRNVEGGIRAWVSAGYPVE